MTYFFSLINERRSLRHCDIKLLLLIALLLSNVVFLKSQTVLEGYLREGLENNESIKQQLFELKKSLYALKEARSLFFPTISVGGQYLKSHGGRTFDVPVGDMLNPVYSTLNQLTGSEQFPQINNFSEQLILDNYYDAKIRLSIPIINSEIHYNNKIKNSMHSIQETEVQIYKRELVKNIKIAYYQYCQASKAVQIHQNWVELAKEGLRINTSLYKNNMANHSSVLRAENEVSKTEEGLFSAMQVAKNCKAYFNFLLNKPLESNVIEQEAEIIKKTVTVDNGQIKKREELKKLMQTSELFNYNKKLMQSYLTPKVGAFLDLGSQGIDWKFNDKTRYYVLGLSLEWKFSIGGGDQNKIKKAQTEINIIRSQKDLTEKQLELQLFAANNSYTDALNKYKSAQKQLSTARKYYDDIQKQYKENMALYIELLDAQNQFINAELSLNTALYDIQIKYAEVERANAGFNLFNN